VVVGIMFVVTVVVVVVVVDIIGGKRDAILQLFELQ
jgi:hypothetical protein